MVGPTSVLRRIPIGLDEPQARSLEAIRLGLEMLGVAQHSLVSTLLAISRAADAKARGRLDAAALLHAWTVVDGVFRLSLLVKHLPGVKRSKSPDVVAFLNATAGVEQFRHYVQHMDRSIGRGEGVPQRPWGAVTWVYCEDPTEQQFRVFVLSPGAPRARVTWKAQGGVEIEAPIGDIHLEVDGTRRSLSGDLDRCQRLSQSLEKSLEVAFRQAFGDHYEAYGADLLVELSVVGADPRPADPFAVDE